MTSNTQSAGKLSPKLRPNQSKWMYALLFGLLIGMFYGRNLSGDVWWHLKTGQWIVQHHALPRIDPFSYTARNPIILHEWGAEVLEWITFRVSPALLAFMSVALISGAFLIAYLTALRRSKSTLASFLVIAAGASASASSAEMRPQVFSFVLLALLVVILQRYRDHGGRVIWLIPPMMLLWVNLHAIFLIGIAVIFLEIVVGLLTPTERVNRSVNARVKYILPLVMVLGASILLTLINPNGLTPYIYPFHVLKNSGAMTSTVEWTPPDFNEWTGRALLVLWGFAIIGLISHRRPTLRDLAYVAIFGIAALRSQRHAVLFSLAAAGPIAIWLAHIINKTSVRLSNWRLDRPLKWSVWTVLSILVAVLFIWRISDAQGKRPFDYMNTSEVFPAAACDFLQTSNLTGPMYNDYNYGGYLIWRLWPKHRVFVDSRQEPFLNGTFEEERTATNCLEPDAWKRVFAKHKINFAILQPEVVLAEEIQKSPDWVCVYADDKAMIFVHNTPENAAVLASAGAR